MDYYDEEEFNFNPDLINLKEKIIPQLRKVFPENMDFIDEKFKRRNKQYITTKIYVRPILNSTFWKVIIRKYFDK